MDNIAHIHPALAASAKEVASVSIPVAMSLAGAAILMLLIMGIGKSTMTSSPKSYLPLIRGCALLLVLASYAELVNVGSGALSSITTQVERPPGFWQGLADSATDELADDPDDTERRRRLTIGGILNLPAIIMGFIQNGLVFIVRLGLQLVRSFLLAFLYIVGPIAIAISLIPGFTSTGLSWLRSFISIQFWELTLNLLDSLVHAFSQNYLDTIDPDAGRFIYTVAANLTIVFLYLMTPRITNTLVSTGLSTLWGQVGAMGGVAMLALQNRRKPKPKKEE